MSRIKEFLLGTDFEVFLQDKETNEIVSAEGIIQGTKEQPFCFDKKNKFYATSLDNVLAEANIPPAKSAYRFYKNVQKAIAYIDTVIPKNLKAVPIPSARLDRKYLQTENALLLGCEQDICAYTQEPNPRPNIEDASTIDLRSAGGHLHVGYKDPDVYLSFDIVKAMDLFIGVPSVIQEPDNERKTLYGRAGACRLKEYGVEYRSPSNYYLASENLTRWIYGASEAAIEFLNNERQNELYEDERMIVAAINNNDKTLAQEIINKYQLNLAN